MSEIVDILVPKITECYKFTVNNAVDFVLASPVVAPPTLAMNASGKNIFVKGDSFRLISAGLILPESFTLFRDSGAAIFDSSPELSFDLLGAVSGLYYKNNSIQNSRVNIPMENFEFIFDVYLDCAKCTQFFDPTILLLSENYSLSLHTIFPQAISMLGVPASMNTKIFSMVPFIKIMHTFDMI